MSEAIVSILGVDTQEIYAQVSGSAEALAFTFSAVEKIAGKYSGGERLTMTVALPSAKGENDGENQETST